MLLVIGALRILVLLEKVHVPLTCDIGVSEQKWFQPLTVIVARLDHAAIAALAPVADRAGLAYHVYMLQHEGGDRHPDAVGCGLRHLGGAVPPEILSLIAGVLKHGANLHPDLLVELAPRSAGSCQDWEHSSEEDRLELLEQPLVLVAEG